MQATREDQRELRRSDDIGAGYRRQAISPAINCIHQSLGLYWGAAGAVKEVKRVYSLHRTLDCRALPFS